MLLYGKNITLKILSLVILIIGIIYYINLEYKVSSMRNKIDQAEVSIAGTYQQNTLDFLFTAAESEPTKKHFNLLAREMSSKLSLIRAVVYLNQDQVTPQIYKNFSVSQVKDLDGVNFIFSLAPKADKKAITNTDLKNVMQMQKAWQQFFDSINRTSGIDGVHNINEYVNAYLELQEKIKLSSLHK